MEIPKRLQALLKNKDVPHSSQQQNQVDLALIASGIGIFSWDITANAIEWDKQLYDLFGIKQNKPIQSCDDFKTALHPDDRDRFKHEIEQALEKKSEFEMDFRVIHPDNSTHYIGARGKVYLNQDNSPMFMTGVCWDMTSHGLAEEKILAAKHLAEESSRSKSNFMARVSHDLRSPLNGIIGFAELMYHGKVGSISDEHKEYLGDILMSARQLLLLINDVVDLAKVESGKMEFHPEKIDVKKILDETRLIFQAMIVSKNITFETMIDPKLGQIVIDPGRLKQVIYNYVSNALKCTNDNGRVTVRVLPNNKKTFRIEVEDTGIGIREVDLKRLFVEFQQLDTQTAKQYSGTGLGLALTKHIVEVQGGEVGATSTFGKGSTFYAILPCLNK